jgi:hypothetical protein
MRMSGAPQILTQWVLRVGRIADEEGKYADAANHDGRQDDQKDARHKTRFRTS